MSLAFYKLTAAGNDFVLFYKDIDLRLHHKFFQKICDRHYGVGADGVLILSRNKSKFFLRYFNPDGTEAFCGNGTRAAGFFIYKEIYNENKKDFEINTIAGKLKIIVVNQKIFVEMPSFDFIREISLKNKWDFKKISYIKTGTYHLVIEIDDDISNIDVNEIGRFFRYHKVFRPHGTNVNFIKIEWMNKNKALCCIRTYEKGVENETLSCSSGMASAFYYLRQKYPISKVIFIPKSSQKFSLEFKNERSYLAGPVKIVFKGKIY